MAKNKRESTRLEAFEPAQLEALAQLYPTIRRELHRQGELTAVRLPNLDEPERRLESLRELESKGDLWIRISYAGNLNVKARAAPNEMEEGTYLSVLRRPGTDWCEPVGRYYPEDLVGDGDDIPVDPVDGMARAQYRVARIVADEVPGIDPAVARKIAERVMGQLWKLLE